MIDFVEAIFGLLMKIAKNWSKYCQSKVSYLSQPAYWLIIILKKQPNFQKLLASMSEKISIADFFSEFYFTMGDLITGGGQGSYVK